MTGLAHERADVSRAGDCVAWSWAALDRALVDGVTDPEACLPFIHSETTMFYWELHFRQQRLVQVDFLHRPALISGEPAGESAARDPIVDRLASWYANNESARKYCHPSVWLELDGPIVAARGPRAQGVSICVDPRFGGRNGGDFPSPTQSELAEIFTGLERACETTTTRARLVAETHQAISDAGGTLRHVSIMRGRAGQPVKVYAGVPKPSFPAFLETIGWPGDREAAARLAEQACAESQRVNVDLLIEDALSPRIGFEIFSDPSPTVDARRLGAIERAVALGLISQRVAEGLQRWVGSVRGPFGRDQWPTTLRRWFDLKFVSLGASGLELKAYLGFRLSHGIFR